MTAANTANNQATGTTTTDEASTLDFLIAQRLSKVHTAMLVLVKAVIPGGVGSPATIDCQPMVNLIDGAGNAFAHGTVRGLPCFRYQGGTCAAIIDPVVGDIGLALICHRDISSVKANKAISNPGSYRRFNYADGVYFGAVLGPEATDFIQVSTGAITATTTGTFTVNAPTIALNGNVATTGTLTNNNHDVGSGHKHVDSGGSGLGGVPQ